MSLLPEREEEKEQEMRSIFTVENRKYTETKETKETKEKQKGFSEFNLKKCPTPKTTDLTEVHESRNLFKNRPNVPTQSSPPTRQIKKVK